MCCYKLRKDKEVLEIWQEEKENVVMYIKHSWHYLIVFSMIHGIK